MPGHLPLPSNGLNPNVRKKYGTRVSEGIGSAIQHLYMSRKFTSESQGIDFESVMNLWILFCQVLNNLDKVTVKQYCK